MSGRYVYVHCMAGFNDILVVLGTLVKAARAGNRLLVLDTRHAVPEGYGVDFWDSFRLIEGCPWSSTVIQDAAKGVRSILQNANRTVVPEGLGWSGFARYSRGAHRMKSRPSGWYDVLNGINMQVSPSLYKTIMDPDDPTGVCVASTWAPRLPQSVPSKRILHFLQPCPSIWERYRWARSQLPAQGYVSVHVRNTDIKSNVDSLLKQNLKRLRALSGAVHLATDDPKTIDAFAKAGIKVQCFATFPDTSAHHFRNLHGDSSLSGTCRLHDAVVDLLLITSAVNLISNSRGGFACLARSLLNKETAFGKSVGAADWISRAAEPEHKPAVGAAADPPPQRDPLPTKDSIDDEFDRIVHAHM